MKKSIFLLAVITAVIGSIFYGCSDQSPLNTQNEAYQNDVFTVPTGDGGPATYLQGVTYCGTSKVVDFFAGQTIDAGSVTIYNDDVNLYVTVFSTYGYQSGTEQLKMWVGTDTATIPKTPSGPNKGNPIFGHFPYKITTTDTAQNAYTFTIPLNSLSLVNSCGDKIYLVIHGDVWSSTDGGITLASNTALGGDIGGNTGNRWWYLTSYIIQCCGTQTFDHEATAYAKGGWIWTTDRRSNPENLQSLRLTKNRWGWAINLPLSDGAATYDIWAGAGLNDTTNGVKAGTLSVSITGSNVTVTYNLFSGFTMGELHIYANDFKPTTIAPGQYGFTQYFDPTVSSYSTTFTLSDTDNDGIWIVAHAVVKY